MKILLAIDGSRHSADAVEAVAARPWPTGTTVRVLSVVEPIAGPLPVQWHMTGGTLELAQQEMTTNAEQLTARVVDSLRARGLSADTAVRLGDSRSVIVDEAKEWAADLIIVGSHGYTGIKQWLLGSVAQSVVSHAPCAVEVVRQTSAEKA